MLKTIVDNPVSNSPIPVVTAFITSEGMLALFQRSSQVGTYKGAWAGVSGYIERLPLKQAYVELTEEAGLNRDDVELQGMGIPLLVPDPRLSRKWLVHPFLFRVRQPEKVRIDWEAERLQWVAPGSFGGMLMVPGLERALARVWPPFGDAQFWAGLESVATDTINSATSLALTGLEMLRAYLERDESAPEDRAVRAFAACRPSMGVFPHLAALYMTDHPSIYEMSTLLADATTASAHNAADGLSSCRRILTNSRSSSVEQALLLWAQNVSRPEVIVAESRPGLEGLALASRLAAEGINVSVITDAQAGHFAQEADAILVGCDAITPDDKLRNKIGTGLIIPAAQSADVPCFAVAQTQKITPRSFPSTVEEQEPDDVGHAEGVRFRNIIFDETPVSAFTTIYTENGALTPEQLRAVRKRLNAAELT